MCGKRVPSADRTAVISGSSGAWANLIVTLLRDDQLAEAARDALRSAGSLALTACTTTAGRGAGSGLGPEKTTWTARRAPLGRETRWGLGGRPAARRRWSAKSSPEERSGFSSLSLMISSTNASLVEADCLDGDRETVQLV